MKPDLQSAFVVHCRGTLVAAMVAMSLCGCATPSWEQARDVSASYDDYRTGVHLTMVNQSHSQYQDLYSKPRAAGDIKILRDGDMRLLLARLDDLRFFDDAKAAASVLPPEQLVGRVLVEIDGKALALGMPRGLPPTPENLERATWFRTVRTEMQQLYNDAFALQTLQNDKGARIFQEQQEKLQKQGSRPGKK